MTSRYSNAVLIYNPEAGRRKRTRPDQIRLAQEELHRAGISVALRATGGPGTGTELTRSALQDGADLIVVCGGDGTINEVVCGMARSSVPLAILPAGTANVLARELQLPLDLRAAARAIPDAVPRRLALGKAGDRHFLLMVGAGLDAQVIDRLSWRSKQLFGMGSYVLEALRQVLFARLPAFAVQCGGKRVISTFACIAKARYYGPLRLATDADFYSDRFAVYCFCSRHRFRYFAYALALLRGRLDDLPDVIRFSTRELRCEKLPADSGEVFFQVDGELAGRLPCSIEIVPDALTLLVPR